MIGISTVEKKSSQKGCRKMDREDETKKYIRENWFKDHKAVLTKHGDLEVLDWRKPGTCCYAVRYVFDGDKMYITGDIGEALFWLTWKANVHSFNGISTGYFMEKMRAFSDDRYDFEQNEAKSRLIEWKNEILESNYPLDDDYDEEDNWYPERDEFIEKIDELICEVDNCNTESMWAGIVNSEPYNSFISEYDCDYWEWIYSIGNETSARIYGYIVGLQMASEQLKESEVEQ